MLGVDMLAVFEVLEDGLDVAVEGARRKEQVLELLVVELSAFADEG